MSNALKHNAAAAALELVESGMVLGLGTGSTAAIFVELLAEKIRNGLQVVGTPTSEATDKLARELGIEIKDPNELAGASKTIDLTIDGADEFDPNLNLIKGGGAALLREKIIADASSRMVVIADASKEVENLGAFPLPVEINPFACELTRNEIHTALVELDLADTKSSWRENGADRLLTDGGHYILDLKCECITDPDTLAAVLDMIPGVVEHGLFIDIAETVIVGEENGARIIQRPSVDD